MITRLISGLSGVAVAIAAVTWYQVLPVASEASRSTLIMFLTPALVMLGVYLMFYCLTGDWLPRLTKRRDQS